ncbi:MAG TPA: hypothetical protein PKG63_03625 [Bacteroidales bacterium]|jgi:hypothetical protein|nr:hypothetical protein [Bacteroidales bacterium]
MKVSKLVMNSNSLVIISILILSLGISKAHSQDENCIVGTYRDSLRPYSYSYFFFYNNYSFKMHYYDCGKKKESEGEWKLRDNKLYLLFYKKDWEKTGKNDDSTYIGNMIVLNYNCKRNIIFGRRGFKKIWVLRKTE